jgi:single-strand DNA-binding protein
MNSTSVSGRLGGDAELKNTNNGKPVLNFNLAETLGFGDQKRTQWFRCAMFGERATKLQQYLKKGTAITVTGEMELREWTDQASGEIKKALQINVDRVALMGDKPQTQQPSQNNGSGF